MCENRRGDTFRRATHFCEIGDTVAESALRAIAVAGVVAAGLMFGGLTAVPAVAQPDDSGGGSSQDSGGTDNSDGSGAESSESSVGDGSGSADAGGADITDPAPEPNTPPDPEPPPPPAEPVGSGNDTGAEIVDRAQESKKTGYSNSITIPMLRLPAAGDIPIGGWPTISTFYTTLEIPVPTFQEFLSALRIVPTPPPPGPAFRTQEEAPVVDATTGTAGGGGSRSESTVFQAPLVTVPRAVTVAGQSPKATPGLRLPVDPAVPGVTQPGVAGAQTPVIRGSVAPTPGVASVPAASPMGGQQPARIGYQRYVRGPTVAELAVVALPGVAGLLLVTFGGGLIGYRQANSVRFVRTAGAERFLP